MNSFSHFKMICFVFTSTKYNKILFVSVIYQDWTWQHKLRYKINPISMLWCFKNFFFLFLLDGIPPIIKLLSSDNEETREIASLAIANLTNSNNNNCQVLMDKNGVDVLIKLLGDQNRQIQCNASITISNLAVNGMYQIISIKLLAYLK